MQASTSLIQGKFSIGYSCTGRIADQLEEAGIIGPFEGSKARRILIPNEECLKNIFNQQDCNETKLKIIKLNTAITELDDICETFIAILNDIDCSTFDPLMLDATGFIMRLSQTSVPQLEIKFDIDRVKQILLQLEKLGFIRALRNGIYTVKLDDATYIDLLEYTIELDKKESD